MPLPLVTFYLLAALTLDRGYGFGVAGMVAIILTGPYIAIDSRDLLVMNAIVLGAVIVATLFASLNGFDTIGTIVFALLAVLVSTLLGRALEESSRRAFALELEMQREARTDTLTGLDNRRAMQERGAIELKRAKRIGAPVSVILGDIDHFKRVNDQFGLVDLRLVVGFEHAFGVLQRRFDSLLLRRLDLVAGARISGLAGGPLFDFEHAKVPELDPLLSDQRVDDRVKGFLHDLLGLQLGQSQLLRNLFDDLFLGHLCCLPAE